MCPTSPHCKVSVVSIGTSRVKLPKAYLVALSTSLATAAAGAAGRAVAGDVTSLSAPVAGLVVPRSLGAITAYQNVRYGDTEESNRKLTHVSFT